MKKCFNFLVAFSFVIALSGVNFTLAGDCPSTPINNGRCLFSKNCFPDAGGSNNNCDSTAPNQGGGKVGFD